jgi:hypothetical protein
MNRDLGRSKIRRGGHSDEKKSAPTENRNPVVKFAAVASISELSLDA